MWIKKLILENFIGISLGLECSKIEIDFSNRKNKICLLVAPNGKGKTTILSMLQPFATTGNLDVRNTNGIVIEGKNGYKELIIMKDTVEYVIKHNYTASKDTHSVKSYIYKDGDILNPNGNVTSFLEFVKLELDIEPDYLKLIRIGDNVSSLIESSTTERKVFMGKLLDDLNIFLKFYKKVNNDLIELKSHVNHTTDKLNKLNINDINVITSYKNSLITHIAESEIELKELIASQSVLKYQIDELPDISEINTELSEYTKKLSKAAKLIESGIDKVSLANIQDKLTVELNKQIDLNREQIRLLTVIPNLLSSIDECRLEITSIESELYNIENSSSDLKVLNDELNKIDDRISVKSIQYIKFKPSYTKEDVESLIVFMRNLDQIISTTYEFGKKPIQKIVDLLRNNENVSLYINKKLLNIDVNRAGSKSIFLDKLKRNYTSTKPSCDDNKCSAYLLWHEIAGMIQDEKDNDNEDPEFYKYMEMAYNNIRMVLLSFKEKSDVISLLPDNIKSMFSTTSIYDKLYNMKPMFDIIVLNDFMAVVTDYNNYLLDLVEKEKVQKNLDLLKKSFNYSYMHERLETVRTKLSTLNEELVSNKRLLSALEEQIYENSQTIESIQDTLESIGKFDEIKSYYDKLVSNKNKYELIMKETFHIISQIELVNKRIEQFRFDLNRTEVSINSFNQLTKELKKFNKHYDKLTYTKDALSNKKGVPLIFIEMFLKEPREIANELLDIVYNGDIYLDEFDLTADEFRMPFINKGKVIDDVKYASQGEIAFLKIALSFALSSQNLGGYNIMLIDEGDSTLDIAKREKYISVIERQGDIIQSEQTFAISHNNMFSTCPVDVISLTGEEDKTLHLANYIHIKKS